MKKLAILGMLLVGIHYAQAQPDVKVWTRLSGTNNLDEGYAIAADPFGNSIIAGGTQGSLDAGNAGRYDLFVGKYDPDGNRLWMRQRGTIQREFAYGVTTDSDGNIYATGYTGAALDGQTYLGDWDIFLVKYGPTGNWIWTRQIGTGQRDEAYAITTDHANNIYITGYVRGDMHGQARVGSADVFICKYNPSGTRLWTRLFGSEEIDQGWGIACDASGNVFVTGYTLGSIENNPYIANGDLFLAKYDTNGNRQWLRQWGTVNAEHGYSLATDAAGNVYLSGYTTGTLYGPKLGERDAILAKFDAAGNPLWSRQFGTAGHDQAWGVAMGADGNIYVGGEATGPLHDNTHQGLLDIFLAKYTPAGTRLWTTQVGTSAHDFARGIATTSEGFTFLGGITNGNLDGNQNLGPPDVFVMKFAPPPPPPPLTVDAGADRQILLGRAARLDGSTSGGTPPFLVQWSPADSLDDPQALDPVASPTTTTLYTLTVTDATNNAQNDSVLVTVAGTNIPGDLDEDGDVDQTDFGMFQACFTGPDIPQNDPACMWTRLDDDDDVDADDVIIFINCSSGPGIPGDPGCAGPFAPTITLDPVGQSVDAGDNAVFTVSASGTTPLSYQWQKNQGDLIDSLKVSGATTSTLELSDVQPVDTGDYRCIVTNAHGSAISAEAPLQVNFVAAEACFTHNDLETYTAGVADGWTASGTTATYSPSDDRYSGEYAQEIKWTTAGAKVSAIHQKIWIEVGVPYTVEAFFRMNDTNRVNGMIRVDYNGGTNPNVFNIATSAPRPDWGSKALTFTKTTGQAGWATVFVGGYGNAIAANDWCRVDLITPACE